MKYCISCKEHKNLEEFRKDCTRKDNKYPYCRLCFSRKGYKQKYKKSDKGKLAEKRYCQNNKGTVNAKTAKHRAARIKATPKWLTDNHIFEIKNIYINCPKGYEVDHIIPLQGKEVCGLHVPWNLQYLTISENRSKNNKIRGL